MNRLFLTPFSWRGTINRRDYLRHTALATLIFAAGFYLQVRYENDFGELLATQASDAIAPLFFVPFVVELLAALSSPFSLPAMLALLFAALPPQGAPSIAAYPVFCISCLLFANLLMLIGGLRCMALAARRLRDAGSGIGRLFLLYGGLVLLYILMLHDGLPFASVLYVLALLICYITQCCMLLRATQPRFPKV